MPSITKLLNRKSLNLDKYLASKGKAPVDLSSLSLPDFQSPDAFKQSRTTPSEDQPLEDAPEDSGPPTPEQLSSAVTQPQGIPAPTAAQPSEMSRLDISGASLEDLDLPKAPISRRGEITSSLPPLPEISIAEVPGQNSETRAVLQSSNDTSIALGKQGGAPAKEQPRAPTAKPSAAAPSPAASTNTPPGPAPEIELSEGPLTMALEQSQHPVQSTRPADPAPPSAIPKAPAKIPQPDAPIQVVLANTPPSAAVPAAVPAAASTTIQTAVRGMQRRSVPSLAIWEPETLKNGQDPLGRGLSHLLQHGARRALFLAIQALTPGARVPHFLGSAAVGPKEQLNLWRGLRWDPATAPEAWNSLLKPGFIELSPQAAAQATSPSAKAARSSIRLAFGVQPDEWLLMIRCGTPQSFRGALAVIAPKSLAAPTNEALPLFSAPIAKAA